MARPTTVDEYIAAAPEQGQKHVKEIRAILKEIAPDAKEVLKWGQPVFEGKRILFAFSAHKAHLNFTPTGPSLQPFKDELSGYKTRQDSVQFLYDEPLPVELIRRIAAHRLEQVEKHDARWMY